MVLILLAVSIIVPVAWVFMASIKQNSEFYRNPWSLPEGFYWQNFVNAWNTAKMGEYMMNSVIVTALALPLKHLALWLMQIFWFEVVANGDAEYYARVIAMNYRALIPTLEFIVDLAFTVTFTACLVPTFYWLRGIVKNRKASK